MYRVKKEISNYKNESFNFFTTRTIYDVAYDVQDGEFYKQHKVFKSKKKKVVYFLNFLPVYVTIDNMLTPKEWEGIIN